MELKVTYKDYDSLKPPGRTPLKKHLNTNFLKTNGNTNGINICKGQITITDNFFVKTPNGELTDGPKGSSGVSKWKGNINKADIVIVLESPHKDEYELTENQKLIANPPAQGQTGINLRNNFKDLNSLCNNLLNLNIANKLNFLVINPVPYQTSLRAIINAGNYKMDKKLKIFIWNKLWIDENIKLKEKFGTDLQNIKPELVLNCCTKDFKEIVGNELKAYTVLDFPHPSCPHFSRKLKDINKAIKILLVNRTDQI